MGTSPVSVVSVACRQEDGTAHLASLPHTAHSQTMLREGRESTCAGRLPWERWGQVWQEHLPVPHGAWGRGGATPPAGPATRLPDWSARAHTLLGSGSAPPSSPAPIRHASQRRQYRVRLLRCY